MIINFEELVELGAMAFTVLVLSYISLSVYRKNPSERLNQLFSLACGLSMLGFFFSAIGTVPGVTPEISVLTTRLFITFLFLGISAIFLVAFYLNDGYLSRRALALLLVLNTLLIFVWLPDSIIANPTNPADITMSTLSIVTIFPVAIIVLILIWYLFYRVYAQSPEDESIHQKMRYFLVGWTLFILSVVLAVIGTVMGYHLLDAIGFTVVAIGSF
ncbi:MAG: hypothetical protein ACFFC7_26330, partial [Candidatus Hermodarchaeota archaeon]